MFNRLKHAWLVLVGKHNPYYPPTANTNWIDLIIPCLLKQVGNKCPHNEKIYVRFKEYVDALDIIVYYHPKSVRITKEMFINDEYHTMKELASTLPHGCDLIYPAEEKCK